MTSKPETVSTADDLLRNGYDRWYRLEEEKAVIGEDLKKLFAELKGHGFTPKALRESFRRVRNINDADQQEHDAIVDLYVASLTGARPAPARVENIDEFDADGVEIESQPSQAAAQAVQAIKSQVTSSVESEAAEISTLIQPETATEQRVHVISQHEADEAGTGDVVQATVHNVGVTSPGEQRATNIATLRQPKPMRPNCLKPDMCGGQGRQHCWICTKAMNEAGAA